METPSRRTVLGGIGTATLGGVAGCLTGSDREESTVRVGLASQWLETLDPLDNAIANRVPMFETLVDVDHDGEIQPALARSWDVVTDQRWRFELRDDVQFHSGRDADADAIAASLDRAFSEAPRLSDVPFEAVAATDEFELEVTTSEPYAQLLSALSSIWAAIVDVDDDTDFDDADSFASVGPFELESWEPGTSLSIVPFEGYYGEVPTLERARFEVIEDHTTRVLNLENDDLDLIKRLPDEQYDRVDGHADLETLIADVTSIRFLVVNTDDPRFDSPGVRQALTYAADKQAIVDGALGGLTDPATGVLPPVMDGWRNEDVPQYEHDPDRARDLLAAAGWEAETDGDVRRRDGEPFEFTLRTYDVHSLPTVAEILQEQYRAVGIECEVLVTESGVVQEAKETGEFDVTLESWSVASSGDPARLFEWYHSEDTVLNMPYESERVDELVEESRAALETDDRQAIYRDLQAIAMEELPLVPLTDYVRLVGIQDRVSGYDPHPQGIDVDLSPVTLE